MGAVACKGTKLQKEGAMAGTYEDVAGILSLNLPEMEPLVEESTTMDQAGDGVPYDAVGYVEGGECSGELLFDSAVHSALVTMSKSTSKQKWKILLPDGVKNFTFTGANFRLGIVSEMKGFFRASFTIKLDGLMNYSAT